MESPKRKSLGQILTGHGIISEYELEHALIQQKATGMRLGEQLEQLNYCTVEDVEWALSAQFDLPLVRLTKDLIDPDAARMIPVGLARAGTLIPTWSVGDELGVVIADPTNKQIRDAIVDATGKDVQFSLGVPSEIRRAIDEVFGEAEEDGRPVSAFGLYDTDIFNDDEKKTINRDPSGGAFLEMLFAKAQEFEARAIYFEHREKRFVIRIRGDKGTHVVIACQADWYNQLVDKLELVANTRAFGVMGVQKGRYVTETSDDGDRWGYEIISAQAGPHRTATCKPFLRRAQSPDITDVDFGDNVAALADALHSSESGIIVADIPNMSSVWMLRAVLYSLNEPDRSIVVVGDPQAIGQERVEDRSYQLFDIQPFVDASLADVYQELRELLPDTLIIQNSFTENPLPLLEESRLAGHKLVTTYQGASALDVALNLHGDDPKGFATSERLTIIAGLPVSILCDECKTEVPMESGARARYGIAEDTPLYQAVGCPSCRLTGVSAVEFVGEVLSVDDRLKQALESQDAYTAILSSGWAPVSARLVKLLGEGRIAAAEYVRLMRNIG